MAETVQHFITAMDSLKLNLVAVDQVGTGRQQGRCGTNPHRVHAAAPTHPMCSASAAPACARGAGQACHPPARVHGLSLQRATAVVVLQICPILSDLIQSMSKIESLPPDFAPKDKAKAWCGQRPTRMRAPDHAAVA